MNKKNILMLAALFAIFFSLSGPAEAAKTGSLEKREIDTEYLIKPTDTLNISVWNQSNLDATVMVDSKGYVNYAFMGDIKVAGRTVGEVQQIITEVLNKDYIANPKVDVSLERRMPTFFVIGEVLRPGSYSFEPNLDPLRAVALAGGFTDYASWKVTILRKDDAGKEVQISVNTKKLLKASADREKYKILPGDTVVVKRSWF
jgi:protein involved in polysaccharide export with SLBB domain